MAHAGLSISQSQIPCPFLFLSVFMQWLLESLAFLAVLEISLGGGHKQRIITSIYQRRQEELLRSF